MPDDGKPGRNCPRCPRLAAFRTTWRAREPEWFNAPVPSFGSLDARLLIVGLAPGLQGANRTGRPFTGDYAGVLLYDTLSRYGFARGQYGAHPDDGLELSRLPHHQCGALRAAGKQADDRGDRDLPRFPQSDHRGDAAAQVVVALGRIAHDSVVTALAPKKSATPFKHGGKHALGNLTLVQQLSLLALQHEYRRADARNVPRDFSRRPRAETPRHLIQIVAMAKSTRRPAQSRAAVIAIRSVSGCRLQFEFFSINSRFI